ncbi:sulfite reductase [Xanthomonas campestris pv. raphani 756C]|nr:sulfite reductase [Xanthomonas campestris pv. raphani 756C]
MSQAKLNCPQVDATLESILGIDLKQVLLSSGRYRRDVY